MKQLLKIALGLVLCLGGFTACDDDENVAVSGFSLSKTESGWLNHLSRG